MIPRILCLLLLIAPAAVGEEDPPVPLDQVLRGKILKLDKDEVEIHYDFSDPVQLKDWVTFKPFRVEGELTRGLDGSSLRLKGVGAIHHRATFRGKVEIEFDITPWSDRDFGAVIAEDAEGDQYVLYSVNDIYFQKWDGARTPKHMICRFGIIDPSEPKGFKVFRYVARNTNPEIKTHMKLHLVASKDGRDDKFMIGEQKLQGKEMGRELNELLVGIYIVKSSAVVNGVTVRGRLSSRWIEKENVKLTLSAPPPVIEGPSKADRAARGKIDRFKMGAALVEEMFGLLEDLEVSEDIRTIAAEALIATTDKSLVPKIISLLYSEELSVRALASTVIKGLTSKTFGYSAKADEAKRSKAIQKLVKYIQKKPAEFQPPR